MGKIIGSNGRDVLTGSTNNDYIDGRLGSDTIRGGGGDDILNGHGGLDRVYGEAGNDHINITVFAGNDIAYGGTGFDTAEFSNRNRMDFVKRFDVESVTLAVSQFEIYRRELP